MPQQPCDQCGRMIEFDTALPQFCEACGYQFAETAPDEGTLLGPPEDEHERETPAEIAGYKLLKELGRGGMGVVFEVEHIATGRRAALKLLSQRISPTPAATKRFLREGQLAASLSHPRSTFVYEAGEEAGVFYIVMELMPGGTLADLLRREGPLPVVQAVDMTLDIIAGLQAAHAIGVIHRDVKPSNCFIDSSGQAKIGDFGLSKSLEAEAELTRKGGFLGTPAYSAPEQFLGHTTDVRADIYATGATIFCLLAGRPPFTGSAEKVIASIASEPPPPLASLREELPHGLERVIARALEKDPGKRYQTMEEFRRALLPYASGGTALAGLGRRLAAYFLDSVVVGLVIFYLVYLSAMVLFAVTDLAAPTSNSTTFLVIVRGIRVAAIYAYFAILEGWTGCGPGKYLTGLRVVDRQGRPPGLWRSCLRALIFPAVHVAIADALYLYFGSTMDLVGVELLSLAALSLSLLFFATIREKNGYAGIHELLSGTRTVQIRQDQQQANALDAPVLAAQLVNQPAPRTGPYQVHGRWSSGSDETVLQAFDDALQRQIWIHTGPEKPAPAATRVAMARRGRITWLQGGNSETLGRWDAYEAVCGASALEFARVHAPLKWSQGGRLLLDLTEELAASLASEDSTVAHMTLDQIWIDRSGGLKLVDIPVLPATQPPENQPDTPATSDEENAGQLITRFSAACLRAADLPEQVRVALNTLKIETTSIDSLNQLAETVRQHIGQRVELRWDDRLSLVAICMVTECVIYGALAFVVGLTIAFGAPQLLAGLLVAALLLTPAALGYIFRGGPVFYFTGTSVRRAQGGPAGRFRAALRGSVAWLPYCIAYIAQAVSKQSPGPSVMLYVFLFFIFLHLGGTLIAVASPARGVQDWLAGTRLTHS